MDDVQGGGPGVTLFSQRGWRRLQLVRPTFPPVQEHSDFLEQPRRSDVNSYGLNDSSGWEASSPCLSRPENTKTRASADSTAFSSTISRKLTSLSGSPPSSASSSYTLKRCAAALPLGSVTWAVGSPGGHMSSSNPGASFTAAMQVSARYQLARLHPSSPTLPGAS